MERAFDPLQVIMSLDTYGLDAVQLLRDVPLQDVSKRGTTKNFTIRATKLPESRRALQEYAERKLGTSSPAAAPKTRPPDAANALHTVTGRQLANELGRRLARRLGLANRISRS